jgi:hypothetical protein
MLKEFRTVHNLKTMPAAGLTTSSHNLHSLLEHSWNKALHGLLHSVLTASSFLVRAVVRVSHPPGASMGTAGQGAHQTARVLQAGGEGAGSSGLQGRS